MKKAIYGSLTEAEKVLVAATDRTTLTELDEEALLELLTRVRRARTKYVTLYRRRASAQVADTGGRDAAHGYNERDRDKAEVFERALSRVGGQVPDPSGPGLGAGERVKQCTTTASRSNAASLVSSPNA